MTNQQLPGLTIRYFSDTDTLVLLAEGKQKGPEAETVADGLVAHFGEEGESVGFTLEWASALLRSHIQENGNRAALDTPLDTTTSSAAPHQTRNDG